MNMCHKERVHSSRELETRDELSVPQDMSGNSLEVVETLETRERSQGSLSREKGENYITLVP